MKSVYPAALLKAVLTLVLTSVTLLCAVFPGTASAQLGQRVNNVATVSVSEDAERVTFNTNVASFTVEAFRSPSVIEFFRYAPNSAGTLRARLNGSDYNPAGTVPEGSLQPGAPSDPFVPVGDPRTTNGLILNLEGEVSLTPASNFLSGELMFVRVLDAGQNVDPGQIETLVITVRSSSGDLIVLRLYESGPNTGAFFAYVPSSREPTPSGDNVLTAPADTQLTATYVDAFDATEVSVDTALIDPFGRVFDSLTGELLNNVEVTIVDAATGAPATVFGVDGVSAYPSTLRTGSVVTDASGLQYVLQPGEFLFPLMAPGDYRLVIAPPAGYFFPSGFAPADLQGLPNGPFTLIDGSYGGVFTLTNAGALNFDVPLDGAGEIVLTKSTLSATASAGDTVAYVIEVENRDIVPAPVIVRDTLPPGFRYVPDSALSSAGALDVDIVSADGRQLNMRAGILRPGERLRLTYAAALTAGVRTGTAVNTAIGVNSAGEPISNRAEAAVEVIEDLLRSRLTLIGRVSEAACDGDEAWARKLKDGKGVAGVRLYMETGDYVVSDENGLFHFEGVRPGTHIVQLDEQTLPAGYKPMKCEENTRYAQSSTSKFVDVQAGLIWRANFYLEKVAEIAAKPDFVDFDDTTEYQAYDQAWLDTASPAPAWVYPETGSTPSSRSVNIGIVHPPRHAVELTLNGQPVPQLNFNSRDIAKSGAAEISRWRGIDIAPGENIFVATVKDPEGQVVRTLTESFWHVADVQRVRLVADQTRLFADGRTVPVIALRLEDSAGHAVHKGRIVRVEVSEPYTLRRTEQFEREQALTANTVNSGTTVGSNGVARIELEPTLQTGSVRVRVELDSGRFEELQVWMSPEKRDWILVGLTEGGFGQLPDAKRPVTSDDAMTDGRVAFFAKGMVKGDWLLTLAVDTAKRRGASDTSIFDGNIDPNAYYTLYGDRTWQYSDAPSRYPVYVKLEKETTQLLFGDYDTDLSDSVLGRYVRRLSGLKGIFQGKNATVRGFAAETNQGYVKDEIAADGTSGPYRLSRRGLVRNSEAIRVETRDRVRPDQVLATRAFVRWVDYEIDYVTGEIIFRHPIDATGFGFNPNVIVADYESVSTSARDVVAGGRAAIHTADHRLEAGLTHIQDDSANAGSELTSLDLTARVSDTTELRAEVATSSRDAGTGTERADAYLVEMEHQGESLTVTGYIREDEAGFGLGQQPSATEAIRRVGADASLRLSNTLSEDGQDRLGRYAEGRVYREDNLSTGAVRDAGEVQLRQESGNVGASVGVRAVTETYPIDGEERESILLTGSARRTFDKQGLTVTLSHEQPLNGQTDEASFFPQRTQLGADKIINDDVTLNLRHQMTNGADASGDTTTLGVTVRPWTGGEVRVAADRLTQDSATRLAATVGADQTVQINKQWTATFGATRRARIDAGDDARDVAPDESLPPTKDGARSPFARDEAFTSAYVGAGYRAEAAAASARVEYRTTDIDARWSATGGSARESSETFSYAAVARWQTELSDTGPKREGFEARLGSAWRPRGEGAVIYNRLDARKERIEGDLDSLKFVNNLGINLMLTDQTQAAIAWGIKYQEVDAGAASREGVTQLLAGEIRHDVTPKVDIGLAGSALVDHETNTTDYAFGPTIGFTPAENVWISVGYNFSGFKDDDFQAAEYTRDGAYIKLRVKFDQHTAEGLLKSISPE